MQEFVENLNFRSLKLIQVVFNYSNIHNFPHRILAPFEKMSPDHPLFLFKSIILNL